MSFNIPKCILTIYTKLTLVSLYVDMNYVILKVKLEINKTKIEESSKDSL